LPQNSTGIYCAACLKGHPQTDYENDRAERRLL